MSRRILGPFNRVEGDLEVTIETSADRVVEAKINAPLYRGFEDILLNRDPVDALTIVPRICGICSISQSVAASRALADAMGLTPAQNGMLVTDLVSAAENIADHLSHFYLFFMPDFARDAYRGRTWFDDIEHRFKAKKGTGSLDFLKARAEFLHVIGILAGKWPHTLAIQPGGTTTAVDTGALMRLLSVISRFREFMEDRVFGDKLEAFQNIRDIQSLFTWADDPKRKEADFARFVRLARELDLGSLGCREAQLMSFGAYGALEPAFLFKRGFWNGDTRELDTMTITENLRHSWLEGRTVHPSVGQTIPNIDKPDAYSWCKAPRLGGKVIEVGALARQVISGHPLAIDSLNDNKTNVFARIVARMIEVAFLVPAMATWCRALSPMDRFCETGIMRSSANGVGLAEAARGSLGHWLSVHDGIISSYQIVAPTTWNFSPRDDKGNPGAAEEALVGTPATDTDKTPVAVQHVIRSFDPCMVCTVH